MMDRFLRILEALTKTADLAVSLAQLALALFLLEIARKIWEVFTWTGAAQ